MVKQVDASSNHTPADRFDQATRYIEALTGHREASVTFQTFPDYADAKGGARILHGAVSEQWSTLDWYNQRGHGVFVMVNAGDRRGRRESNVVALRALFIDDDDGVTVRGTDIFTGPRPSMTVRAKRGPHHYWLLRPGEPLDRFTEAQAALASHFGTDPTVKDLPRVMRLPGLLHQKDPNDPVVVRLVYVTNAHYSIEEVMRAYPGRPAAPSAKGTDTKRKTNKPNGTASVSEDAGGRAPKYILKKAAAYIKRMGPAIQGQGGDAHTFGVCCALVRGFALSDADAMELLAEWNSTCQPPWRDDDLAQKLSNARASGRGAVGGLL